MKHNKIFTLLLSLLIAVGLWIYVVTTVTPEDSQWVYNIPVTFENEDGLFSDRNLTLTEGRNTTVNLKFKGNRQELTKLSNTNITVSVDLTEATGPGVWFLSYDYTLPETVNSNSVRLESRSASSVEIVVDEKSLREVPVRAVFKGDVAEGYSSDPISLEYDALNVSGPAEIISRIAVAEVVLERTNLSKTVSDELLYTFLDENNEPVQSDEIHCDVDKIGVMMTVNMVKEVPLVIQYIDGGGATSDFVVEKIEPSTVTIKGDAEELEGLNSLTIAKIDLSSVQTTYTQTVNIVIPDGMTILSETTANIELELVGLTEKTFRVTNLELANAPDPENLMATLGTTSLQVKLRGPDDVMELVGASNIRAVADLSFLGSSTGMFSVTVQIYVDGFTNVGAMGTYSVLVSISEPAQVEASPEPAAAYGDYTGYTGYALPDETDGEETAE